MADDRISWLVFLLQEQKRFKEANEVLEDFIQKYPNNRPVHLWELVEINRLLGKNEQARVYFEEHRRYYPNDYYAQILSLHPSLMIGEPIKSDASIRQQPFFQRSPLKNWYGFSSSFLDAIGLIK
jgi:tetratricopeptide (TPR) repeat protein